MKSLGWLVMILLILAAIALIGLLGCAYPKQTDRPTWALRADANGASFENFSPFGENAGWVKFVKTADGATSATAVGATGKETVKTLIIMGGALGGGALGLAATGGSPVGAILGAGGGGAAGAVVP